MAGVGKAPIVGLLGLAAILGLAGSVTAEDSTEESARAVRLSLAEGAVRLDQGGQTVIPQALLNTPLFEGAQISTGDDARAEVQFEDGSVVRMPPDSAITLTVLRNDETEVTVNSGIGYFELQGGSSSFKVRFDRTVATAIGFTVLRVKSDNPPGNLAVFSGNAHLEGPSGAQADILGGETATEGPPSAGRFDVADDVEPDSWDAWNSDRDQAVTASESAQTPDLNVPDSGNPAWSDLGANGTWYNTPDQGYVWSPYEAANPDWDPYGLGSWSWTPGYGYVWVSGYSWGYMPYQCGYWNWYDTFGWGWAPGVCQTWWTGGGGWYWNVRNCPRWYHLPVRPGPKQPRNPEPRRIAHAVGPQPVIPVVREPMRGGPRQLPPRDRRTPVLLSGRLTAPVHTISRPDYRPQQTSGLPPVVYGSGRSPNTGVARQGYVSNTPAGQPLPIYRPMPGPSTDSLRTVRIPTVAPHPAPSGVTHSAPAASSGGHVSAPAPSGGGHSAPAPAPTASSHK